MLLLVLGGIFAVVGIVVVVGVAIDPGSSALLSMGIVFVVVGAILLAVGVAIVGGQRRRRRVLAEGIAGTARITSVTQTNTMINNQPVMVLRLMVNIPDRPPYEAHLRQVIPFVLLMRAQPGSVVAVKVDPNQADRPVIDWNAPVAGGVNAYAGGGAMAGVGFGGAGLPAGGVGPANVPVPSLPPYAADLPVDQLREQVRSMGATGRAVIDSVQPTGAQGDRAGFTLGMWVQLDSGPAFRVDNAPAAVEQVYAGRVAPGVTVPLRIAQVRPGVTMTVLEWEKL